MRLAVTILSLLLSLFGCGPNPPLDPDSIPQTEGEKRAAAQRCPPGWRYVKVLDERGRVLEEGWEYKRPPDRFETDGLSHLRPYVDKLLKSTNWFTSVSASTIDGEVSFSVRKIEGRIELVDFFDAPGPTEAERTARALCKERGYPVADDYVTDDGTRIISWGLPQNATAITEVLERFVTRVHKISKQNGLDIEFEEHPDDRDKYPNAGAISFTFTLPIEDPTAPPPK